MFCTFFGRWLFSKRRVCLCVLFVNYFFIYFHFKRFEIILRNLRSAHTHGAFTRRLYFYDWPFRLVLIMQKRGVYHNSTRVVPTAKCDLRVNLFRPAWVHATCLMSFNNSERNTCIINIILFTAACNCYRLPGFFFFFWNILLGFCVMFYHPSITRVPRIFVPSEQE